MRFDPLRPQLEIPPGGARKRPPRDLVWLWMLLLLVACLGIAVIAAPALR